MINYTHWILFSWLKKFKLLCNEYKIEVSITGQVKLSYPSNRHLYIKKNQQQKMHGGGGMN